jgi:hypothetical protein
MKIHLRNSVKLVGVTIIGCGLLAVLILLLPYQSAKSFAEDKVNNTADIIKTEEYNPDGLNKIFAPEYLIYSKIEDKEQAVYVRLQRLSLISWEVAEFKILNGDLIEIEKSIEEEKITPNDFTGGLDLEAIDRNNLLENYEPGSSINDIETLAGDKIQVILGENQQDNELKINLAGTGIKNVSSVNLSPDEKYIYYSKFSSRTLNDGFIITTSEGKVYRYDIAGKREEMVHSFDNNLSLSFRVNSKYIFYTNSANEVGKIDLISKQKALFDTSKLNMNLEVEVHGDIGEYTPLNIINIDEESGILEVALPDVEPKYFRIRLSDLSIT